MKHYDLLVIGGGSGGLAVSQAAAKHGKKVAVVDMGTIGGTCVNLGCVPKKIMWYAGEIAEYAALAETFGFALHAKLDFKKLVAHRQKFIHTLNTIYSDRLKKSKITYIHGIAKFIDSKKIEVNKEIYSANHIVIATGTHPVKPNIPGAELGIDSDGFFALEKLPKKVVIVGGGYIAMELSSILNQLGSEVKVLIRKGKPFRNFDSMISEMLVETMSAQGVEFLTNHETEKIVSAANSKLTVHCNNKKIIKNIDAVIFAIGRKPTTSKLNLKAAGIKTNEKGYITTNKNEMTNVPRVYAIGDVAGKKLLTPVAVAAGRRLAERIFGKNKKYWLDYENIPTAIFTHPPAASVGLSEQDAITKYGKNKILIEKTHFNPLFYSLGKRKIPFQMKLISLKQNEKIIGCHLVGINADEIIQGFALAIKVGAKKKDFEDTVGIHPTSAEELLTIFV